MCYHRLSLRERRLIVVVENINEKLEGASRYSVKAISSIIKMASTGTSKCHGAKTDI